MPIVCWGNLAKSADDTQKIEQSIGDYVEGHNIDVNAHQIEGSSLYMHRVNEILDHMDGSVELRKLPIDKLVCISAFEGTEGWNLVGAYSPSIFGTQLYWYSTDDYNTMWTPIFPRLTKLNFSKNPFFQTTVYLTLNTHIEAYIVAGREPSAGKNDSFGFYIHDAALYAYWTCEGVQHTEAIADIDVTAINIYRANYDSTESKLYFSVNGILRYTATSNLPVTTNDYIFTYHQIRDSHAFEPKITACDFWYQIDR